MRLMQQDVERLETLDVSGKTQAAPDTAPNSEAPPVVEPEADTVPPAETTPPPAEPAEAEPVEGPRPRAESESPNKPKLQSDPTGDTSPPSINAMRMPVPNAESERRGRCDAGFDRRAAGCFIAWYGGSRGGTSAGAAFSASGNTRGGDPRGGTSAGAAFGNPGGARGWGARRHRDDQRRRPSRTR